MIHHRAVGVRLTVRVHAPVRVLLQVAVAGTAAPQLSETLAVDSDGRSLCATEVAMPDGGRVHLVEAAAGMLTVDYRAQLTGPVTSLPVTEVDRITYLRPSRYAQSDRLAAIARTEFAGIGGAADLLAAVSSWTGGRLCYVPGSSGAMDGAVDTLLSGQGVCRDYAHLVVSLLRALDVPARVAAVYAPGLRPMDFHAVAEAAVDGRWRAVDATLLAPRSSLVRIATGRDAADTAFLSTFGGLAELLDTQVTAVVDGNLPIEDVHELVSIC